MEEAKRRSAISALSPPERKRKGQYERLKRGKGTIIFADDIILLADRPEELQKLLKEVEKFSKEVRMKFNSEKVN